MIELSGGVAAAARSPAVRPRLGAGSLAAPGARAPTRSHGARGARRGPDPVPLAGGLRGLPGRRRGGGAAAGRVAVGRERPARPLRLQVPQPADHAHLRLLPALPGTRTARPASPSCARRGRTGARLQPRPQTSRPARPAVRCPSADFAVRALGTSFPASSALPKGKRRQRPVSPAPSPGGTLRGRLFGRERSCVGSRGGCVDSLLSREPPAPRGPPRRGCARRAQPRRCPRAHTWSCHTPPAPSWRPPSEPQAGHPG